MEHLREKGQNRERRHLHQKFVRTFEVIKRIVTNILTQNMKIFLK